MPRLAPIVAGLLAALVAVHPAGAQLFETKAARAYLVDAETGTVFYSKAEDEGFPPASLAKLMTVEIAFKALKEGRLSPQETFYVSEYAWRTGGAPSRTATMFAEVTSSVPLEALIQGIIVQSANDGCIILAEGMAGSEAAFARMMTERARAIGLERSTFVNSTGLPAEGQEVTARELTELALHLWREYPRYYRYFAQPDFEWNGILQRNRNPLLRMDIGADGLKTGHTEKAGYAITASVEQGGRRLFATLAGMASEEERAEEARKLLEWGMRAFERRQVFAAGETVGQAVVYGGEQASVELRTGEPLLAFVPTADAAHMTARITYEGPVPAPVEEGARVGTLEIWLGDTLSQEAPLYAAETVAKGTLGQRAMGAVRELLVGWMR